VSGAYICHKPLPPIPTDRYCVYNCHYDWEDSVYQITQQFGVDWKALCAFNKMKDCSVLDFIGSALKIPVRLSGFQQITRSHIQP
jgi:hypothetical protein